MTEFHPNIKKDIIYLARIGLISSLNFSSKIENTPEFLYFIKENAYWNDILRRPLSEEFLECFYSYFTRQLDILIQHQRLSMPFIKKHWDSLCQVYGIFLFQEIHEEFIIELANKNKLSRYHWETIASAQYLSESFIVKFKSKLPTLCIIKNIFLSEDSLAFILENCVFLTVGEQRSIIYFIFKGRNLSEKIIRILCKKCDKTYIPWALVSSKASLSEAFLEEFSSYINWRLVLDNPNIEVSESFYNKHFKNIMI